MRKLSRNAGQADLNMYYGYDFLNDYLLQAIASEKPSFP